MKVREIMSTHVRQIESHVMLSDAAERMREYDVGILPVVEDYKTVGLITDRDIVVRAIAAGMDPRATAVKESMTPEIAHCDEDDDLQPAARLMEDQQIHRLVVLNHEGTVVGILSIGDLAFRTSDEHLAYEVLERVCEPVRSP